MSCYAIPGMSDRYCTAGHERRGQTRADKIGQLFFFFFFFGARRRPWGP